MNEYTQSWGILPHLSNGEMFAITLLVLTAHMVNYWHFRKKRKRRERYLGGEND